VVTVGLAFSSHLILICPWIFGVPVLLTTCFALHAYSFTISAIVFFCFICFFPFYKNETVRDYFFHVAHPKNWYCQCDLLADISKIHDSKSFFACHPHGILCVGYSWNLIWNPDLVSKKITYGLTRALRLAPFFRIICDLQGWLTDVQKSTMKRLMSNGDNYAIIPGGFEEATLFAHSKHRVFITKRKGFIKYCLEYGYRLHPVYTFGEEKTFHSVEKFLQTRLWFNTFGIPGVLFWGEWWIPFIPKSSAKLVTVIGDAIELPHISKPTTEDVNKWHAIYIAELTKLFDEHKSNFGITENLEIY